MDDQALVINTKGGRWFGFFLMPLLLLSFVSHAQVGIGTTNPASTLDIVGSASTPSIMDGLIPPRVTGNQLTAKTYASQHVGAMIYVTATPTTTTTQTREVKRPGMYFFNGTRWVAFHENYYGSVTYGDIVPITGTQSITGITGCVVSATRTQRGVDFEVSIVHNLNLQGSQRVNVSAVCYGTQNDADNCQAIKEIVVYDVTPNSFRFILQEWAFAAPVQNLTFVFKITNY
ncbi:MAG TPA: hypothetical protein VK183_06215 [Flavobacterium sp.]|nr:hypothetical protein [Flavobacterium sp.]